jgi:hypothetical protein
MVLTETMSAEKIKYTANFLDDPVLARAATRYVRLGRPRTSRASMAPLAAESTRKG